MVRPSMKQAQAQWAPLQLLDSTRSSRDEAIRSSSWFRAASAFTFSGLAFGSHERRQSRGAAAAATPEKSPPPARPVVGVPLVDLCRRQEKSISVRCCNQATFFQKITSTHWDRDRSCIPNSLLCFWPCKSPATLFRASAYGGMWKEIGCRCFPAVWTFLASIG